MADISSITLPGGGMYDLKDKNAVPKYGMGKNLLRNWYFVGGGTGRGVFPVNTQGLSSYTATGVTADGWKNRISGASVTLDSTGLTISKGTATRIDFFQILGNALVSYIYQKQVTLSIMLGDGRFLYSSFVWGSSSVARITETDFTFSAGSMPSFGTDFSTFFIRSTSSALKILAIKLELGTEQTLCHQENGTWVLNEIPDYEEELLKCQTSPADSTDTYANKSLATEQQLAYVETGTTASRDYLWDEFFWMGGILYRTTKRVNNGAPFTVGTNCEPMSDGGLNKMAMRLIGATVGSETIQPPSYQCLVLATRYTGAFLGILYTITATTWYLIRIHDGISDISLNTSTGAITFPSYTQYVYFW